MGPVVDQPVEQRRQQPVAGEVLGNGGSKAVLVPTRYPGSESSDDDSIRTGRRTEWIGSEEAGFRGMGQREWVTDAGETALMDVRHLVLSGAAAPAAPVASAG